MAKVKYVGVFGLAKLQGLVIGSVGLLCGIAYSFGGLIYDLLTTGGVNTGTGLAFFALPVMPAMFAAFGFVVGIAEALIYNLVARWFGGVDLGIE